MDNTSAWRFVSCTLCGANVYKKIFVDTVSRNAETLRFTIVQCRRCGLIYVNPVDTQGIGYSFDDVSFQQVQWELDVKGDVYRYALQKLQRLQGDLTDKRLLDIGCGCGAFLDMARMYGYTVQGVDMSASQVSHARERLHLEVIQSDTIDFLLPGKRGYFDTVTMWDVLEHIVSAKATIETVWQLLKPDGILMIKIPNSCFQLWKARLCRLLFPAMSKVFGAGDHVIHFTRPTISRLLHECGFRVTIFENSQRERSQHSPLSIFRDGYFTLARVIERLTGLHIGNYYFIAAQKQST